MLTRRLLRRIETANTAGAQFRHRRLLVSYKGSRGVRKDPDFIHWINGVLADVVGTAQADGADVQFIEPTARRVRRCGPGRGAHPGQA